MNFNNHYFYNGSKANVAMFISKQYNNSINLKIKEKPNTFDHGNFKKFKVFCSKISITFKYQQLQNCKCKVYQPGYHLENLLNIVLKMATVKAPFSLIVFWEIVVWR